MAVYNSDLAVKGTYLRQSHQEGAASTIAGQIALPQGTVISTGDQIVLATLPAYHALTYFRIHWPGLDDGSSSGAQGVLGFESEGSLQTDDADGYSAAADDGAGTFTEGDVTGTRGTVFPGTSHAGGKLIWDDDFMHIVWTADNASAATAVDQLEPITFVLEYKRINYSGGSNDGKYLAAPVVLEDDPEIQVFDYNGARTGFID